MTALPNRRVCTVAIVTLMAGYAAHAQNVDTSNWKCELCPFEDGYRANYAAGATYVSDDEARFGNGSGYDDIGTDPALAGDGKYVRDGAYLAWQASELGLDSRRVHVEAGRPGSFGAYLSYDEVPYRLFGKTATIYRAAGNDAVTLPAGWVAAGQTTGFTDLQGSVRSIELGSDRETLGLGGQLLAASNIELFADYRRQRRDGIDIVAGSIFTQAAYLPRSIDFTTDLIDAGVRYASGPLTLTFAWHGSFFENGAVSLTWDTPFSSVPGAEQGRVALEPDNDFQQVLLRGSYRFDSFDAVVAFSSAMGRGEQNQAFIPYTINANLNAGSLPRSGLDGKVDTANHALTFTARPFAGARLKIGYRFDERDNSTARSPYTRVIVDRFVSGETELNTPFSYERSRISLRGDYDLFDDLRVSAGYERKDTDRDFQEVAEESEDIGWGQLRWQPWRWLSLDFEGGTAKRDIDRYDTTVAAGFEQNPLLRKYNLAYRYRRYGELRVNAAPPEWPLSIGATALYADDSYTRSLLGMTDSDSLNVAIDLSHAISERASLYVHAGQDRYDAMQTGSEFFAAPDWQANHEDRFDYYGGGFTIREIGENTDLSFDYMQSNGTTDIRVTEMAGDGGPLPQLQSDLQSLRLELDHRRSERLSIAFSLRYERLDSRDFALAGGSADAAPTLLTFGADPYNYDVWVYGLSFDYRVGPVDIAFPE